MTNKLEDVEQMFAEYQKEIGENDKRTDRQNKKTRMD